MACALRRPGRISVISQAAGPVRDGCRLLGDGREPYRLPSGDEDGSAALVRPCRRRGWRGIGRLTPVVAASREAAHLAKVERQIADQAALRTIAGGGVTEGGRVATALCLFTLR